MLSYQTALKLKEAGYPHDWDKDYVVRLDELVWECRGDNFTLRFQVGTGWEAATTSDIDENGHAHAHGSSAEEVMASLWLSLNT